MNMITPRIVSTTGVNTPPNVPNRFAPGGGTGSGPAPEPGTTAVPPGGSAVPGIAGPGGTGGTGPTAGGTGGCGCWVIGDEAGGDGHDTVDEIARNPAQRRHSARARLRGGDAEPLRTAGPIRRTLRSIELALQDARALALELEGLLAALAGEPESVGARLEAAMDRIEAVLLHDEWPSLPFADELRRLQDTLGAHREDPGAESFWPRLQVQLSETYEAVAAALRADDAPTRVARPTNWSRSGFHVSSALFCLFLTLVVFTPSQLPWAAAAFAGTAWFLEALRRISPRWNDRLMSFFRAIVHPSERWRVNSATWYMTALVGLAATGSTVLAVVGVTVLGFGDPLAGMVGRRFGRVQLVNGRTLEGSLAFVVVGTTASFGVLQLLPSVPAFGAALVIAATGTVFGAVAEALSRRVDDNLSVPWCAALGAMVAVYATGGSPW